MLIPRDVLATFAKLKVDSDVFPGAMAGAELTRDGDRARMTATNRHWLLTSAFAESDSADYPIGCGSVEHVPGFKALVPMESMKGLLGMLPKGRNLMPILSNVLLEESTANGSLRFVADLPPVSREVRAIEGDFPKWQRIMPSFKSPVSVSFDPRYMIELCNALIASAPGGVGRFGVTLTMENKAVCDGPFTLARMNQPEGTETTVVLMPLNPS